MWLLKAVMCSLLLTLKAHILQLNASKNQDNGNGSQKESRGDNTA